MKRLATIRHTLRRERLAMSLSACMTAALFAGLYSTESGAKEGAADTIVVYPEQAHAISFSHSVHEDEPCSTCHGEVAKSTLSTQSHSPSMQVCATCHTQTTPRLEACSSCHVGYSPEVSTHVSSPSQWRAISPAPLITPRSQASLTFSHAAHDTSPCSTCHDTEGGRATMPSMPSCTTCHDNTSAPAACSTCHTRAHTSQLEKEKESDARPAPPSMLSRPADPAPESHAHDWIDRHGIIALTESDDCMSCHTESSCASCHNARSGQPLAHHPPNYLVEHRLSARLAEQNCTDCHRQEASCVACHTRTLAAPASEVSQGPPPAVDFHPPTWLDASSANNHGVMAKRNINECASCHQEQDCISCHQGISPHPPEFAMDCARIMKRNPISCGKCHTGSLDVICPTP